MAAQNMKKCVGWYFFCNFKCLLTQNPTKAKATWFFVVGAARRIILVWWAGKIIIINLCFRLTHLKIKTLIIEMKKLKCMKMTTSFYYVIQLCQVHKFLIFMYFVTTQNEKFICEINIITMIYQKLQSPIQQNIKLPSN